MDEGGENATAKERSRKSNSCVGLHYRRDGSIEFVASTGWFNSHDCGSLTNVVAQIAENNVLPVNERLKCCDSRKIIFPGKNADGWWMAEMLVQQVRNNSHYSYAC